MDKNSNKYIFIYSVAMVVIVALVLTSISVFLQPKQKKNIDLEKKRNILSAIKIEYDKNDVEKVFDEYIIEMFVINTEGERIEGINPLEINLKDQLKDSPENQKWPIYIASMPNGEKSYIFSFYGTGLWGPIWGYVALKEDFNTVTGAYFDHKSETPGLGAEIATENFQMKFTEKTIFNENGEFVSIDVRKGGVGNDIHAVDAISGGTITSTGLKNMLHSCFSAYLKFIEKNKN
ncbi:MAG: NADH:ubiquinone reductase (Na(+)-transporting) subunit C [Bacteroidales bacterium]|nr:NADH:ubiquinone reductase (Na(+)-transporting) subunit C [Bacteroidales bacterium]HOL98774.1 NADH:ubiquinone reductase (Na(+)-transporting) subunit C [Bacteroidales bacterium]HPD24540.1 NADH:ubiquinone reductase (Na(+)-transporting) subunit C [Bacteroidales bacterium]HRT00209.1 NADH:ubiquinone reductase (Na(+)-transporting) subunit C [Bacteroidales bacterium]HUM33194.1 NADH:ubiquinone reductase (Na(+)-transporting) subunit C [Bacteroidales bacterium]